MLKKAFSICLSNKINDRMNYYNHLLLLWFTNLYWFSLLLLYIRYGMLYEKKREENKCQLFIFVRKKFDFRFRPITHTNKLKIEEKKWVRKTLPVDYVVNLWCHEKREKKKSTSSNIFLPKCLCLHSLLFLFLRTIQIVCQTHLRRLRVFNKHVQFSCRYI